jgi:hypothetical protein
MPPPMPTLPANGPRPARRPKKPRCQDCFFHQNMLCALGLDEPCPTFRPAHPDGLLPPPQLSFVFRTQAASPPPVPAGEQPGWGESSAVAFGG